MNRFSQIFTSANYGKCCVIGMIHVRALPGTPRNNFSINEIIDNACMEADIYKKYNIDGVLVENMHDIPYLRNSVGPEIVSCMTRVCGEVKRIIGSIPLGVQVLAGANKESVAIAGSVGGEFVRVEGFVYSHVADEGWMDACAGELLRYRRAIDANDVLVFTDIKKKHSSHSVTSDLSLLDMGEAAEFFQSDGIILTGSKTGDPPHQEQLTELRERSSLPIIIGSGVTDHNICNYKNADAVIVGSFFKEDGMWHKQIQESRIQRLLASFT